jgi:hypothetical protein
MLEREHAPPHLALYTLGVHRPLSARRRRSRRQQQQRRWQVREQRGSGLCCRSVAVSFRGAAE